MENKSPTDLPMSNWYFLCCASNKCNVTVFLWSVKQSRIIFTFVICSRSPIVLRNCGNLSYSSLKGPYFLKNSSNFLYFTQNFCEQISSTFFIIYPKNHVAKVQQWFAIKKKSYDERNNFLHRSLYEPFGNQYFPHFCEGQDEVRYSRRYNWRPCQGCYRLRI